MAESEPRKLNLKALVGGLIGGMAVLVLGALIAVLILVVLNAKKRVRKSVHISGIIKLHGIDNFVTMQSRDIDV